MKAFFNSQLIDETAIQISPFCDGFQFGIGTFTTCRILHQKIQFYEAHLARLKSACSFLKIPCPNHNFAHQAQQLCTTNKLENARGKIMIWKGKHHIETIFKVQKIHTIRKPKIITIASKPRFSSPYFAYKTFQYAFPITENETKKYDDILYLDQDGFFLETIFCNIFFQINNTWCTPATDGNLLSGIMRDKVISICKKEGINIIERKIHFSENITAAFTTNCIHGIVLIQKIDDKELHLLHPLKSSNYSELL